MLWNFGEFHWKLFEPSRNLQNPTQMLSYIDFSCKCSHLANIDASSVKSSSPGCSRIFVDCRMDRCEAMGWMWVAHKTTITPSISRRLSDMYSQVLRAYLRKQKSFMFPHTKGVKNCTLMFRWYMPFVGCIKTP